MEDLEFIRSDDDYREVMAREVMPGDVAVYYQAGEIAHTAVVLEGRWVGQTFVPLVVSKWGDAAEYIHSLHQSPYGAEVRFWTDRTS
jgi:hypothetical protein